MPDQKVSARLLAIPDGIDSAGLMMTVQVMPWHDDAIAGTIELADWPARIADFGARMRVSVVDISAAPPTASIRHEPAASMLTTFLQGDHPQNPDLPSMKRFEAVTRLWKRIFATPGFAILHKALHKDTNALNPAAPDSATGIPPDPGFRTSRTSDLSVLLDAIEAIGAGVSAPGGSARAKEILRAWLGPDPAAAVAVAPAPDADYFAEHARSLRDIELISAGLRSAFADPAVPLDFGTSLAATRTMLAEFAAATEPEVPPFPETLTDPDPPAILEIETCKRKLGAIAAIPTLAHYFGLAIQLTIPVGALGGRTQGMLRAEFVDAGGNPLAGQASAWTAFDFRPAASLFAPLDGPISATEDPGIHPYREGFLKLNAQIQTKDGHGTTVDRFRVDSCDVVNTFHRLQAALARPETAEGGDWRGIDKLRRGIALFDRYQKPALRENYERRRAAEAQAAAGAEIVYLRDLLVGLRPDIGVAQSGIGSLTLDQTKWCALTYRKIVCKDEVEKLLDPVFYNEPAIKRIAHHDHGMTMVPERIKPTKAADGRPNLDLIKEEELVTWAGESLALAPGNPDGISVDPNLHLGLTIDYTFPEGDEALLPPLREDRGYVFGARLVFPNGVSRTFADAKSKYSSSSDVDLLIGRNKKPYPFPAETIPPPLVLLDAQDPLVVAPDAGKLHGETSDRLVVRDAGPLARERTIRLMLPPRVSFDRAESERQFDNRMQRREDRPIGAFMDKVHIRRSKDDGAFPEARLGSIWYVEGAKDNVPGNDVWTNANDTTQHKPVPLPKDSQSRGKVALLSAQASVSDGRYYASRHAGTAVATLRPATVPKPTVAAAEVETRIAFWGGAGGPNDALPVVIELVRSATPGASFNLAPFKQVKVGSVRLPHLRVDVGPAQVVSLEIRAEAAPLDAKSSTVLLVNACRQPLRAPTIRYASREPPIDKALGFNALTVTVRDPDQDAQQTGLPTWAEIVDGYEHLKPPPDPPPPAKDMLEWPSSEGGSVTFFVGRVLIDRKSTGSLRCEATWDEYDEQRVTRLNDLTWTERAKTGADELFSFEVEEAGPPNWVDLLRKGTETTGELRQLFRKFPGDRVRARRLRLSLVATSRFASFFYGKDATLAERRACEAQVATGDRPELWTECTFRPPPPRIDRVVPIFDWEAKSDWTRRTATRLRLYLDEGWYASGEGEQLAIVLSMAPPIDWSSTSSPLPVRILSSIWRNLSKWIFLQRGTRIAPPSPYESFLSRSGVDPIRPGGRERSYLKAEDFPSAPPLPSPLLLFLSDDSADGIRARQGKLADTKAGLPVTVLPLVPKADENGALYCEVEIAPSSAYTPFVQLGLARYQPHAVEHLKLSPPIQLEVQLLPSREINIGGSGTNRIFNMSGPGYGPVGMGLEASRSTVDLRLVQWDEAEKEWIASPILSPTVHLEVEPTSYASNQFTWRTPIRLPFIDDARRVALLVEEFEHLPAEKPTAEIKDGLVVFRPTTHKRLVFSYLQRIRRP